MAALEALDADITALEVDAIVFAVHGEPARAAFQAAIDAS